ncbi:MAG: branched-chain amino acid ABC transporter permease [Alphaproteobacteria bacterium]
MRIAAELVVNGILLGGLYALMACGLNLIFGVMKVINFAHGEFLAIGALSTVWLVVGLQLPFWVALVLVPIGMGALGVVVQTTLIRRVADGPMIMSLLLTYALSTILVNVAILIWGGGFRGLPGVLGGSFDIMGLHLSRARLLAFAVAMAASIGVWVFLNTHIIGKAIRAVSQEPEIATISGISVEWVRNLTFGLGAAMAGAAGVLIAPMFASEAQLGVRFLIKAFAVIIIGGMGSYTGAMAAAIFLGVVEVVGGYWLGQIFGTALLYGLMLAVLLVRPRGLLGIGART